ncbi:MAG TPA: hypothetical protein VLM78_00735, partial [Anaerolineales bacterium]|nr:hypothetical protein [Anaerolineales bacterium]
NAKFKGFLPVTVRHIVPMFFGRTSVATLACFAVKKLTPIEFYDSLPGSGRRSIIRRLDYELTQLG